MITANKITVFFTGVSPYGITRIRSLQQSAIQVSTVYVDVISFAIPYVQSGGEFGGA
jgi:hypothetical protein